MYDTDMCVRVCAVSLREDARGVALKGITLRAITSLEDVNDIIREGALNRSTDSHRLNEASSRSHAVFQLHVHVSERVSE